MKISMMPKLIRALEKKNTGRLSSIGCYQENLVGCRQTASRNKVAGKN